MAKKGETISLGNFLTNVSPFWLLLRKKFLPFCQNLHPDYFAIFLAKNMYLFRQKKFTDTFYT